MKSLILITYLALISSSIHFAPINTIQNDTIFYSADYETKAINETNYNTQCEKTFNYLNINDTWENYRGDNVKVAVIDSGINYDHEDFMVDNLTTINGTSKYYEYQSNKWVYYKASSHGYNYIDDSYGHGTNVAATIAAAINNVGGLGIAPNVDLYIYKVTNSSNGYQWGAIQCALQDCIENEVDIINLSFQAYEKNVTYNGSTMPASSGCSTILSSYINKCYDKGITLVAAAGNYNTDEPSYPGSNYHVINVGSFSENDKNSKAGFSNYGTTIDLVAPGYVYVANKDSDTSYKSTSGTSFSAPIVTGAIALYKQKHPDATPSEIESALYASCDEIDDSSSLYSNWAGHGSINIEKFLEDRASLISVTSDPESITLAVGETSNLTLVGHYDDGTTKTLSEDEYEAESNDNNICTFENGIVTATGEGTTTLNGYAGNDVLEFSINVTVTSKIDSEYWALSFLNNITCDNGKTPPSNDKWTLTNKIYKKIDDKNVLQNATGNEYGTNVEKAIIRYDYIISKYNIYSVQYDDYIGRNTSSVARIKLSEQNNNTMLTISIVSVSFISIFSFVNVLRRKRKY